MKKIVNVVIVLLPVAFLIVFAIQSCRDNYSPLPQPSIEGRWRSLVPANPPREFDFREGVMTQTTFAAGVPVAEIQRVYAVHGDTLRIGGDVGDAMRGYTMRFIGWDVVEVTPLPGDTLALAALAYWERL